MGRRLGSAISRVRAESRSWWTGRLPARWALGAETRKNWPNTPSSPCSANSKPPNASREMAKGAGRDPSHSTGRMDSASLRIHAPFKEKAGKKKGIQQWLLAYEV